MIDFDDINKNQRRTQRIHANSIERARINGEKSFEEKTNAHHHYNRQQDLNKSPNEHRTFSVSV